MRDTPILELTASTETPIERRNKPQEAQHQVQTSNISGLIASSNKTPVATDHDTKKTPKEYSKETDRLETLSGFREATQDSYS